jgi:hypothetical protein
MNAHRVSPGGIIDGFPSAVASWKVHPSGSGLACETGNDATASPFLEFSSLTKNSINIYSQSSGREDAAMRKFRILMLFVLLMIPSGIYGSSKLYFGVNLAVPGPTYDVKPSPGFRLWLGFNEHLAVELNIAGYKNQLCYPENGLDFGTLSTVPIELNVQGRLPITKWLVPYVFVGGGYLLNNYELASHTKENWLAWGRSVQDSVDNSFSFLVGMGWDFFIGSKFVAHIHAKYQISRAKASREWTDLESGQGWSGYLDDLRLDTVVFGAGLGFSF